MYLLYFIFPALMAYAAASDLLTMRIANYVSVGLVAAFFAAALTAGMPMQPMLGHIGIGAGVLVVGMGLFAFNLAGGGDIKLLAAASLWIGPDQVLPFLLNMSLLGAVLALALLAYRRMPAGAFPLPDWAMRLHRQGEGMPYGVAIAVAALGIYPQTLWPTLLT